MRPAVFAIPGDKDRRTGGFIYEARVLHELNALGCETAHLVLPDSFPAPTQADMDVTLNALRAVPREQPIILDGLVFGAIDPEGLAQVQAPVIAMIHHPLGLETGLPSARAQALLRNEAAALRHVAHVIVPSPETKRVLCADFGALPERITVAPPGFDRPKLHPQPENPPLILSVGLLAPRKGHDVLLSALAMIHDLPWRAEIVGKTHDGGYAAALRKQCGDLHLTPRVTFCGELGAKALDAKFNAASVFALATRYEGYGMVLSEAMLYGLPVVTCAVGAVPATVGDAALLVPADTPPAFAAELRHLLTDPAHAKSASERSGQRARGLPDWKDTARVFIKVIGDLAT